MEAITMAKVKDWCDSSHPVYLPLSLSPSHLVYIFVDHAEMGQLQFRRGQQTSWVKWSYKLLLICLEREEEIIWAQLGRGKEVAQRET